MAGPQRILICDDQPMIHETLGVYLKNEGFEYCSAMDGQEATDLAESYKPDLIILDIMMPKKSGVDVCREIRATSRTPIIMLTAKGEEIDRILGLELGADDYIVKPFSPREVVARVKAVLRRKNAGGSGEVDDCVRAGDFCVNLTRYEVRYRGENIVCTPKEVEIYSFKVLKKISKDVYRFEISCSSGTYIRSLARDLAYYLGTYGSMQCILRTRCGNFYLKDASTLEELKAGKFNLIEMDSVFDYEKIYLTDEEFFKLDNGQKINSALKDGKFRLYNKSQFLGVGEVSESVLKFKLRLY